MMAYLAIGDFSAGEEGFFGVAALGVVLLKLVLCLSVDAISSSGFPFRYSINSCVV